MTPDELARQLHDRATRGETLSIDESMLLHQWYERQDREEYQLVGRQLSPPTDSLQSQVDLATTQLGVVAQRIQRLAIENEVLAKDVAALREQLAKRLTAQPA